MHQKRFLSPKRGGWPTSSGAASVELKRRDHDIRIVLPFHGAINRNKWKFERIIETLGVPMSFGERWCAVYRSIMPGTEIPVYFIEHDQYFNRPALYQWDGEDYDDNAERFAFFSRACCQLCKATSLVARCHSYSRLANRPDPGLSQDMGGGPSAALGDGLSAIDSQSRLSRGLSQGTDRSLPARVGTFPPFEP